MTAFLILWLCECVKSCVVYLPGFTVRGDIGWVVVLESICCALARITLSEDNVIFTISQSVRCLLM